MDTLSFSELRDETFVAKKLRCEVKTVQAWRTRGGGPKFVKVGRLVRYRDGDIESWVASRMRSSTSEPCSAT